MNKEKNAVIKKIVIPEGRNRGSSTHPPLPNETTNDMRGRFPIATLGNDANFMRRCFSRAGFTLIELLVVVLIIGILAAVALPQYQKAVEKSKATQAFVTLKSVQQAFEAYRLANGEYPTKFEDTAISLPSMTGNVAQIRESDGNTPDTISDKDWSLQIQTDNLDTGSYYLVLMSRISGQYQGAGFQLVLISNGFPEKEGKIVCNERVSEANFLFTQSAGSYCKNIFKGTLYNDAGIVRNYSL